MATFKTVRVHVDYHVEIARHRYSVPHALVGQTLDARLTAGSVELLHRGRRVAIHVRSSRAGGFTTVEAHMPAAHRAHRQWSPARLVKWGSSIGPATGTLTEQLLTRYKHPEQGYRACLGLLSLERRYGPERLDAACALALSLGTCQYRHVRDILHTGRDQVQAQTTSDWVSPAHAHLRGPAYYQ
jgi:transposase